MSKIQPGNGYGFTSSGYGFSINAGSPFNDPEQGEYRPLYATYNGTNKYLISPGTVNRIVPKIGEVYLDAATKPQLTVTASGYICVLLTHETDSFFPRTATIILHPGAVTPVDTETTGYYPLAKVNVTETEDGTKYETIVFSYGNFVCNRLKAGANTAVWYWAGITPQAAV
jgi:hypothetical protein